MFVYVTNIPDIKQTSHKIPKNGIFMFDNFISDDLCDEIRNTIENSRLYDERLILEKTNVSCLRVYPTKVTQFRFHEYIVKKFMQFGSMMSTEYAIICNDTDDIQYRKIIGATKFHYDGIREDSMRSISVILALNDDYEGGELVFPLQDYKIKLKKGQLIAFPPFWTHPHYTNELENGTFRYTINFWFTQ
jgi:predicted 2-oxoglutarate/Fe(II)-dependent dioxygenase YbiX